MKNPQIQSKIVKSLYLSGLVSILFLVGCGEQTLIEPEPEQVLGKRKAVLVENFAVGSIVRSLLKDVDIQLIEPVPRGQLPDKWQPDTETIRSFNSAKPLIFISGKPAPWIELVSNNSGVINALPRNHNSTNVGTDPKVSILALDAIAPELARFLPNHPIKSKAAALRAEFADYRDKMDAIKLPEPPEFPVYRELEPSLSNDLSVIFAHRLSKLEEAAASLGVSVFEHKILPILETHCIECHDDENEEGELSFDRYLTEKSAVLNPKLWEKVTALVEMGQMPPAKRKTRPTDAEKQLLANWSEELNNRWITGEMGVDPGMTTVHRLNKNEFNYTIRDLFGLQLRPADNFPQDSGGEAGFDNNADALFLPMLLMENYIEAGAAIVEAIYTDRNAKNRYLFARPTSDSKPNEAAKRVLSKWSQLIYRKRFDQAELNRLVKLFEKEYAINKSYDQAMAAPLYAMLISPNFLYRSTLSPIKDKPYRIDDFELASRLSYFIWSSMPDRELFGLAAKGELRKPEVIEAQVKRMLADKKSSVLGMHFAGQWFQWELLRTSANPDREKYPEFDFSLRVALYQESTEFFNHLVKNNLSAYQLIDADYTFLNERLARHYKIPGVTGNQLRPVKLTDPNRGGVLGMGSVMTATALPLRSSPAVRGSFVLDELLGTPPPEPPMDVEQLPDDDRKVAQTFREALVQHREDKNCKSCHELIDPIGFGLESFDAIGRFRKTQNGLPLDTAGEMPDGTKFSSPAELKKALLKEKDLFAKNMVEKVLSYALGRELSPYDRPTVNRITKKVIADDARIQTAFIEVARSYPMLHRRGDRYQPTPKNN